MVGSHYGTAEHQPEGVWVPGLHEVDLPYLDCLYMDCYVNETNIHIADKTIT